MYLRKLFVSAFALSVLAGCGGSEDNKNVSQVVMKVNGEEVTVHQYNQLLQSSQYRVNQSVDQDVLKQKVADALLEQVVILQAAREAGFERMPDVLSAVELAKNKAIADMYIKKTLQGGLSKVSEADVLEFYNKNPLLFKERKLFMYDNYIVPMNKQDIEAFAEKIKTLETSDQVSGFLKSENVEFKYSKQLKTSEQLPKPLLKPMNVLKKNDIGFLRMNDGVLIVGLNDIQPKPVLLESVKSGIERQMVVDKMRKATSALVGSLKQKANVEYIGDFKKIAKPDAN